MKQIEVFVSDQNSGIFVFQIKHGHDCFSFIIIDNFDELWTVVILSDIDMNLNHKCQA